jgi:hypothetical protein
MSSKLNKYDKAETPALIEAVGKAYRAGQLVNVAIARKYDISNATVVAWAKKYQWKRDLSRDVRIEAKRKSMAKAARKAKRLKTPEEKAASFDKSPLESAKIEAGAVAKAIPDEVIVEEFSSLGADVLTTHRAQINALRGYVGQLGLELATLKRYYSLVARKIDGKGMVFDKGEKFHVPKALYKVKFLGTQLERQSRILRDLTQSFARLVPLERQAFSLDSSEDERTYEAMLEELYGTEPPPTNGHGTDDTFH